MEIREIKTITKHYRSAKGNDYQIVRIELIDIPDNMHGLFSGTMYGTINYKYITDDRLNTVLTLGSMCVDETIPGALERRKDVEECEGKTIEEIAEYFMTKATIAE
nr:MAG TPA: hypothetical protein [Caudoviricetes sp.]